MFCSCCELRTPERRSPAGARRAALPPLPVARQLAPPLEPPLEDGALARAGVSDRAEDDAVAHEAAYYEGIAAKALGQLGYAEDRWTEASTRRPGGAYVEASLLELGLLRYERRQYDAAARAFDRLLTDHPRGPYAGEAARMHAGVARELRAARVRCPERGGVSDPLAKEEARGRAQQLVDVDRRIGMLGRTIQADLGGETLEVLTAAGTGFEQICEALIGISKGHPEAQILFPVHLNPNVRETVKSFLSDLPNLHLIEPLEYQQFVYLMNQSTLLLTDSGGLQEEAPSLGKPVLLMRDTTERPEAVEAGTVKLVGTNKQTIVDETMRLLNNSETYRKMSYAHNPYGDGKASEKIMEALVNHEKMIRFK